MARPKTKTEPTKIINIAVPETIYKQMVVAKMTYNDNLTEYVNKLIADDLDKNLDTYKEKLIEV